MIWGRWYLNTSRTLQEAERSEVSFISFLGLLLAYLAVLFRPCDETGWTCYQSLLISFKQFFTHWTTPLAFKTSLVVSLTGEYVLLIDWLHASLRASSQHVVAKTHIDLAATCSISHQHFSSFTIQCLLTQRCQSCWKANWPAQEMVACLEMGR